MINFLRFFNSTSEVKDRVCLVIVETVRLIALVGDCYLLARVAPDNNEGGESDDEGNKSE